MPNPLTYPTSRKKFSLETFANPGSEYRGAPFWGWVTKQEKERTVDQVEMFKTMGMGGFHMHTRVGLDIPYLGEEFMDIVKGCVERAKELGLNAFLYDEDRWPSGFAGGLVMKDRPDLQNLHVLFTPWPYGTDLPRSTAPIANASPVRSELGELVATYAIRIDNGKLASSRRLVNGEILAPDEVKWYAYCEPNPPSEYMGDLPYPDLLNPEMSKRFIETTHEVFKDHCEKDFGSIIPSIFSDEPQYSPLSTLNSAIGKQDVFLPWTLGLEDTFRNKTGKDLLEFLPCIVWDQGISIERYHYLDHLCELFSTNYWGTLAKWCDANNLLCTGHMNAEPTLASQTAQNGEVMRAYRDMSFPGIDMLCDNYEFNTAKQAASVVRQMGRTGMMCEMYGVTGWQFTFEGHKGQGDWQAAIGVTLRVHHLFWSTMKGEAKRDYPACIGYQSPWWKEYSRIENHFARVNSALTRGRPLTRVAVVHPVESYWLCYGPKDQNSEETEFRDKAFEDLTQWLLLSHLDFDFISESLFPSLTKVEDISAQLPVGQCTYDAVILPNLRTIRSTTLERLRKFAQNGGKVIIAGDGPELIDAQAGNTSIPRSVPVAWSKAKILSALQPYRDLEMSISKSTLIRTQGVRADSLIYQLREDGDDKFLFIANIDRKEPCPVDATVRGEYSLEVLDTMTGETWNLASTHENGWTKFSYWFDGCASVLLRMRPGLGLAKAVRQVVLREEFMQVSDVKLHSVSLSEPNALLLDFCKWKWNDEEWQATEEVLRIDQLMRERLGFFRKGAKFRQPHTIPPEKRKPVGTLRLRFPFSTQIDLSAVFLAIESPETVSISVDGVPIAPDPQGWWVDRDIETIPLPHLAAGDHYIDLEYGYQPLTALERIYILGDFGVSLRGRSTKIIKSSLSSVEWGDITRQDLPFYSGNITYHCSIKITDDQDTAIRVPHFAGPAVAVDLDGERKSLLIHDPYIVPLGKLLLGEHKVDLTCFGNRYNAFGALHLVPDKTNWLGADTWRTDFDWWSEEYVLGQVGILNAPRVLKPGKEVPKQVRRGKKN